MPAVNATAVVIWKRRFRRLYRADVAGLKTLAGTIAGEAGELVTVVAAGMEGANATGVVTGNKLEMLAAAEELIEELDPPAPPASVRSRVWSPDYRGAQP